VQSPMGADGECVEVYDRYANTDTRSGWAPSIPGVGHGIRKRGTVQCVHVAWGNAIRVIIAISYVQVE